MEKKPWNYLAKIQWKNENAGETLTGKTVVPALLEMGDAGYTLSYSEQAEGGEAATRLSYAEPGVLTVERQAQMVTRLQVEKGRRSLSEHRLPFGSFTLGITGTELISDISEDGGSLIFSYDTDEKGKKVGSVAFDIRLKRR
ncbi:MAG: DUF1934 domain-containing protein [Oscillospiraceae bacterium]|nr:DUF1934 domain-containing protein [Oscillospiraceae bacterium]